MSQESAADALTAGAPRDVATLAAPPPSDASLVAAGTPSNSPAEAVSAAMRPMPALDARTVDQVSAALLRAARAGESPTHIEIELDPPELGRLRLEIRLHGTELRVAAWADEPGTAQALGIRLADLRVALSAHRVDLASFTVVHGPVGHTRRTDGSVAPRRGDVPALPVTRRRQGRGRVDLIV